MKKAFWQSRRVLITGHTGFKGSWLALWLAELGAHVYGFALHPPSTPNLFEVAQVRGCLAGHTVGDVREFDALAAALHTAAPDIVFHLAAQALVRRSYAEPVESYRTNVMGTVHLLEAVRTTPGIKAVVVVTSDKCYDNREWVWPYREPDPLGGHEPYASSKACAELVTAAYRQAFLRRQGVAVATARSGNVIGGGDWAEDRLIPDCVRARMMGPPVRLRSPEALRPWQHVLDPLAGYLLLAERLTCEGDAWAEPWNFGPDPDGYRPVQWIVEAVQRRWPDLKVEEHGQGAFREAQTLKLDSSKARAILGWRPRWALEEALNQTLTWYEAWQAGRPMQAVCLEHIRRYQCGLEA